LSDRVINYFHLNLFYIAKGHYGRDHTVIGFTSTYAIIAYYVYKV